MKYWMSNGREVPAFVGSNTAALWHKRFARVHAVLAEGVRRSIMRRTHHAALHGQQAGHPMDLAHFVLHIAIWAARLLLCFSVPPLVPCHMAVLAGAASIVGSLKYGAQWCAQAPAQPFPRAVPMAVVHIVSLVQLKESYVTPCCLCAPLYSDSPTKASLLVPRFQNVLGMDYSLHGVTELSICQN